MAKAVNLDKAEIEKNPILSEEYDSILNEISKQKEGRKRGALEVCL